MKIERTGIVLVGLAFLASGCASSLSGSAYSRDQARTEQSVRIGTVDQVRTVQIEGTKTAVGPVAGAAVGGLAGSTIGGGRGRDIATVVGAVVGGLAGAAAEEGLTRQQGLEITVRLDNGELIAVTQAADEAFAIGDRVRLVSGGGTTRVTH